MHPFLCVSFTAAEAGEPSLLAHPFSNYASASNILGTWLGISSQASHHTHITGAGFHTYRTERSHATISTNWAPASLGLCPCTSAVVTVIEIKTGLDFLCALCGSHSLIKRLCPASSPRSAVWWSPEGINLTYCTARL